MKPDILPETLVSKLGCLDCLLALETRGQAEADTRQPQGGYCQNQKEKIYWENAQYPSDDIDEIRFLLSINEHENNKTADDHEAIDCKHPVVQNTEQTTHLCMKIFRDMNISSKDKNMADHHENRQVAAQSFDGFQPMGRRTLPVGDCCLQGHESGAIAFLLFCVSGPLS